MIQDLILVFVAMIVAFSSGAILGFDSKYQELFVYQEKINIVHKMLETEGCAGYSSPAPSLYSAKLEVHADVALKLYNKLVHDLIKCRKEKALTTKPFTPVSTRFTTSTTTAQITAAVSYRDCQQAYENGQNVSGIYEIVLPNLPSFSVWCDFFDNHGWTVIQKRFDGSVDFQKNWADYKNGFGNISSEYWLGNDRVHALTQTNQKLNVYMKAADKPEHYLYWNQFYISDESDKYRLRMSGYSGDLVDMFLDHEPKWTPNGMQFTTKDRDNDNWDKNCAIDYKGGWWYNACHVAQLNGKFGTDGTLNIYHNYISQPASPPTIKMRITRD